MKNELPMGVSQWRAMGEKYGYFDFFEKQIKAEIKDGLSVIFDAGGDEDLIREVWSYFNGKCLFENKEIKKEIKNDEMELSEKWHKAGWDDCIRSIKEGTVCLNCGKDKDNPTTDWCLECLED